MLRALFAGAKYGPSFKAYLDVGGKPASFFHDLPLSLNGAEATMVVEIPRNSQGKFEISKELPLNPIVQDTKKGKLRFVNNVFPFNGYPCNYGAFPQTWEDPSILQNDLHGDNDPLDVLDIGGARHQIGSITTVKILGALALIDDGEMDWKIVTIDSKDPLAKHLDDVSDVEKKMPGLLPAIRTWFKDYKRPTGKPENAFAFDGKYLSAKDALEVIEHCHDRWRILVRDELDQPKLPQTVNSTLKETPGYSKASINLEPALGPEPIPSQVDTVYYY